MGSGGLGCYGLLVYGCDLGIWCGLLGGCERCIACGGCFRGFGVGCVVLARCGVLVVLHGCWVVGCWFRATSWCFVWVRLEVFCVGLVVIWEIDLILGFGDFLSTLLLGLV